MGITLEVDRRVRRSQESLIGALLALLKEKPLQDISVNAITEKADVNRSTFYAHYTDKYALFQACIRSLFEDALHEKLPEAHDLKCETIKYLILVTCEFFGQFTQGCTPKHKQLDPIVETEVQSVLYSYLLGWMQATAPVEAAPEMVQMQAMVMSWAIFGAGIEFRHRANGRTAEDIASVVYQLLAQPVLPGH